jgi:hypothetical protein
LPVLFLSFCTISAAVAGCSGGAAEPEGSGGATSASGGATSTGGGTASGGSSTGGTTASGGTVGSGGTASGGTVGSGGSASGGTVGSGGSATGGSGSGGKGSGGAATGGSASGGSSAGGSAAGGKGAAGEGAKGGPGSGGAGGGAMGGGKGGSATGGSATGGSGAGGSGSGMCTASKATGKTVSGTGPHQVVIETNSANGIKCGTIYRPKDLGTEKYPIFVWGEGGCSQDGYSNQAAMAEIASWGYFIVADGTPGSTNACAGGQDGKAFLDYLTWAIAENGKSCSAYYNSLDTTKIAANGFSCGGLMAIGAVGDKRITTWGVTSSGMKRVNEDFYKLVHTPVLFIEGGTGDVAYEGGQMGYAAISKLGVPVMWFDKALGHGGDLSKANGGDFTKIHLAWLNWQLKGDTSITGKGLLTGPACTYCKDSSWDVKSANIK